MIYHPTLHSDDANKCLHYKSGSRVVPDVKKSGNHWVPNLILYEFVSPGLLERSSYDLEKCFP